MVEDGSSKIQILSVCRVVNEIKPIMGGPALGVRLATSEGPNGKVSDSMSDTDHASGTSKAPLNAQKKARTSVMTRSYKKREKTPFDFQTFVVVFFFF
jgi:hypothetical protein